MVQNKVAHFYCPYNNNNNNNNNNNEMYEVVWISAA